MRAQALDPARVPPSAVVAGALAGSVAVGGAMAQNPRLGVAAAVALCFAPLVLLNLRLGIVLWLPTVSLIAVEALDVGPNLGGLMLAFAWFGAFAARRSEIPATLVANRRLLVATAALVVWTLVSMAWAVRSRVGSDIFFGWIAAGAIAIVVSTTLTERRYLRLAAVAFVAGAVISVAIGLVGGAVQPTAGATQGTARLVGGSGDPNFLAAGIVPAIVLAFGVAAGSDRPWALPAVLPVVGFLVVGLVASQSRGGLAAGVVATAAALVLARRRRGWIVVGLLWMAGIAAASYMADPGPWQRLADFEDSSGRSELWTVAWRMWQDSPVVGVGLQGFLDNAGGYARDLGPLRYADFITEQPHEVHNSYLELLAETGIVGLTLYVGVVAVSVRSAWLAVQHFQALGDAPMASLAKAVIVGLLALLTAAAFISSQTDRRTWVLLALGPALLVAARRQATGRDGIRPPGG